MQEIAFTKVALPYGWLGNMSPHPIECFGVRWNTSEALFQALRFDDQSMRDIIRAEKSPMAAKLIAKKHADKMVVKQKSDTDLQNMAFCIRLKVQQHPALKQQLLDTGDALIIEDCTKRGKKGSNLFWGAVNTENGWVGENRLGLLWMQLRASLRTEQELGTE